MGKKPNKGKRKIRQIVTQVSPNKYRVTIFRKDGQPYDVFFTLHEKSKQETKGEE